MVTVAAIVLAALFSQAGVQDDGFVALFDGRSLTGWQTIPLGENPGTWVVRDGVLTHTPGDSWIATTGTYTDFVLRLEYRTFKDTDSGIFLRSPAKGYPSFTGMEFEIRNDPASAPTARSNTALYGAAAARKNVTKADGAWNLVEISLIERRLVATWNGETIHELDLDDPAYAGALRAPLGGRAASGHIGFQAHLTGTPVEFRAIRLKVIR
jgi:Domain of Unknown Function (DUF1080)